MDAQRIGAADTGEAQLAAAVFRIGGQKRHAPDAAVCGCRIHRDERHEIQCRQHCQNGTPDFLKETLGIVRQITTDSILLRMDSGNDSQDNLDLSIEYPNTEFIVKRNLRRESCKAWADFARKNGRICNQSSGKIV